MSISSESSAESASQMSEEPEPVKGPPRNVVTGLINTARPRQWVKNLLVLAAPIAALGGPVKYDYHEVWIKVAIAFVVFCMAASAVYLVNDARDVEADRQHPTKRFRPIAAGVVPEWLAYTLAAVLGVASLVISWFTSRDLGIVTERVGVRQRGGGAPGIALTKLHPAETVDCRRVVGHHGERAADQRLGVTELECVIGERVAERVLQRWIIGPLAQHVLECLHRFVDVSGLLEDHRTVVFDGGVLRVALECGGQQRESCVPSP